MSNYSLFLKYASARIREEDILCRSNCTGDCVLNTLVPEYPPETCLPSWSLCPDTKIPRRCDAISYCNTNYNGYISEFPGNLCIPLFVFRNAKDSIVPSTSSPSTSPSISPSTSPSISPTTTPTGPTTTPTGPTTTPPGPTTTPTGPTTTPTGPTMTHSSSPTSHVTMASLVVVPESNTSIIWIPLVVLLCTLVVVILYLIKRRKNGGSKREKESKTNVIDVVDDEFVGIKE